MRKTKPQGEAAAKTTAKKQARTKKETASFPDNSILDTENFDIGGAKLTEKEKLFVFWYTYPGSDAFQVQTRAAAKAGYKQATALGYRLRTKPSVAAAIHYVLDTKVKIDLDEEFHKIIELKKRRIHYDIGDYVHKKEKLIPQKDGEPLSIEVEELKDLADLSAEQRQVIDGIDYKGMQGIKVYTLADRDKAMNDLLTLRSKLHGNGTDDDADMELTTEIIKEGLAIKVSARKKKKQIEDAACFFSEGDGVDEL